VIHTEPSDHPPGRDQMNVKRGFNADDIKVEFHPHSSKANQIFPFDDFTRLASHSDPVVQIQEENRPNTRQPPWHPFTTRTDFELAELMLDTHLNENQSNIVLKIVNSIAPQPEKLTIVTMQHFSSTWEFAQGLRASQVCNYIYFKPKNSPFLL